ncbi:excisionase family DNA binding protein [Arthrobacter sp. UYNi723]
MSSIQMLTAAELATRLNVSPDTVRRMCNSGKWPHSRIGRLYRFTEEHYEAIIATPEEPEHWTKERQGAVAKALRQLR